MSRTAARNWANGYRTYRDGQFSGFVPGLDWLEVREVSVRFLSEDERVEIADLRQAGLSGREIARRLGRAPSAISRELRCNATARNGYRPSRRSVRRSPGALVTIADESDVNDELRRVIGELLELLSQRWSPQPVSRHLRQRFPADPVMWLCRASIYQAVYRPGSAAVAAGATASFTAAHTP